MNSITVRIVGERGNVYCKRYSIFSFYGLQGCCLFSLIFCFLSFPGGNKVQFSHNLSPQRYSLSIVCGTDKGKIIKQQENMLDQSMTTASPIDFMCGNRLKIISLFFLNKIFLWRIWVISY